MDTQGEHVNSTQISKENDFFVDKKNSMVSSSHSSTLLSSSLGPTPPNQRGV